MLPPGVAPTSVWAPLPASFIDIGAAGGSGGSVASTAWVPSWAIGGGPPSFEPDEHPQHANKSDAAATAGFAVIVLFPRTDMAVIPLLARGGYDPRPNDMFDTLVGTRCMPPTTHQG